MILFHAGPQATKVRIVWIVSLVAVALSLAGAGAIVATPAGEGTAPLSTRISLAAMLVGFLGLVAAAMTVYARCYVERLELVEDGSALAVFTLSLRGERLERVALADLESSAYSPGQLRTVRAPWWSLRVHGRALPLILDGQGFAAEPDVFDALLSGSRHPALRFGASESR